MDRTNAERQMRHRLKVKEMLAQAENKVCSEEVEAFRKKCNAKVVDVRENISEYNLSDLLIEMLKGRSLELQGPFLARALNLPADPWPGLTRDALRRMTKGRVREAKELGVPVGMNGSHEVDFFNKLLAAKNRSWLEHG